MVVVVSPLALEPHRGFPIMLLLSEPEAVATGPMLNEE